MTGDWLVSEWVKEVVEENVRWKSINIIINSVINNIKQLLIQPNI